MAGLACPRNEPLPNPSHELIAAAVAARYIENHSFRLVHRRVELESVQQQNRLEGGVANPFVAVDERVVLDQRKRQRGSLGRQVGIQILACERHPRLRSGRLESPEIPKPRRTTPSADQAIVEHNDLTEGEVPHLGETPVQFAVLRQHSTRSVIEIGGGLGDEIANSGCSQLVDGHVETLRGFTELALGVVG